MEIANPRRILVLALPIGQSAEHRGKTLSLVEDFTGSVPEVISSEPDTIAGTTHTWNLKTAYYTATVPIWIDEIGDTDAVDDAKRDPSTDANDATRDEDEDTSPRLRAIEAWKSEFSSPEAAEVVRVVAGWILCFPKPVSDTDLEVIEKSMRSIASVLETTYGPSWDGTCLAVALHQSATPHLERSTEDWEGLCTEHGFEFIDAEAKGRNEYGEPTGIARLKEAMEATDWAGDDDEFEGMDDFGDLDDEDLEIGSDGLGGSAFDEEQGEMNAELWGLKASLLGFRGVEDGDESVEIEEQQVEQMTRMMARLQAVKETSASMPEEERKRFAARAVRDIVKDLG